MTIKANLDLYCSNKSAVVATNNCIPPGIKSHCHADADLITEIHHLCSKFNLTTFWLKAHQDNTTPIENFFLESQ
eukprot:10803946-Ditylum_brightwellii.AAC.1